MQVFFCLEVFVDDVKHRGLDDLKGVLLCFIELFFLFSYPFCSIRGHELPPREIFFGCGAFAKCPSLDRTNCNCFISITALWSL